MSNINENILVAVSVNLLYDGMSVKDDIYDSTKDRLLISRGNTLDESQIEKIKRLNSGKDTIYVTGRTHKYIMLQRPGIEIETRHEVEESTGYAKTKEDTFELLEIMAVNRTIDMESIHTVSDDLSKRLESTPQPVIISLINAMAPVDEYLQRHSVNVSLLNGLIGRWMGMSESDINNLILVGLLHDCGKTRIPSQLLNYPRKLTIVEYEVMKNHVDYTYELLHEFPELIRLATSSHHERIDGTGYSRKLANVEILLEARITAVSDTYDAMTAQRAYQKPKSPFRALAQLSELSQSQLDDDVVRIFLDNMPGELLNKPIMMSNGKVGIVREYDRNDIEFPMVDIDGHVIKCSERVYPLHMFSDD
jgi:HD-GYP domain-containing protein (c-di-GMP phosphodiesterase class II)